MGTDLSGLGNHPGDYENGITYNFDYAMSPVIDCRNYENCLLTFERQLGIDKHKFDKASIQIKNDTSNWITVWENANTVISDADWTKQEIDISEYADGHKILIRFTLGPTDHAEQYCGWNIDDFMIAGTEIANPENFGNKISIYPNPSSNYFYIDFLNTEDISFADVIVSDLSGKTVYNRYFKDAEIKSLSTSTFDKKMIKINLNESYSGVFIVKVKTDKENYSGKVILMNKKK